MSNWCFLSVAVKQMFQVGDRIQDVIFVALLCIEEIFNY